MKNKKIKIVFFLPNLHGGGAERVTINIIRQLDKSRYDISLVLVKKTGEYIDLIPEYVKVYDLKVSKTIFSILKLHKLLIEIKPDIVFSSLFRSNIALYLSLIGLINKPKIILRSPNSPKLLLENNELNMMMKFLLEKAYNSATLVIAQTPEMKDEIVQFHGIARDKIKTYINPLDTELIENKVKNISNPFEKDYINVVAAGRLSKQKGFDTLIKAFKKVVEENNKFRLHIIGNDSGERENLIKLAEKLKISKYISFLGFQDNPYKYFYFSDLYVLSSIWEGLPNTVLENLYLNKPVVATKCIPFMKELIRDGDTGFLVDVGDVDDLAEKILKFPNLEMRLGNKEKILTDFNDIFLDVYK
jgi:glycosyltransferase involved in cell wall biosynthesis